MKSQLKLLPICILMILLSLSLKSHADTSCTISGKVILAPNETVTYSIPPALGRSYFWSVTGNLSIIGSNTGTSITVRAGSCGSGAVHITTFGIGKAPCYNTLNINIPCTPQPVCSIDVNEVDLLQGVPDDITFASFVNLGPNTVLTAATFQVFFESGNSVFLSGLTSVIPGYVEATYPVACSNPVDKVIIRVNGRNTINGQTCFDSFTEYAFDRECGDNDGVGDVPGLGSIQYVDPNKPIDLNFGAQNGQLMITDMEGELQLTTQSIKNKPINSVDMSQLKIGKIYVARFIDKNGKIETKKFLIKK